MLRKLHKIELVKNLFLVLLCSCSLSSVAFGSQSQSLIGHWEGAISHEGKIWRVWLDIKSDNTNLKGTADFPDYGLYALPVSVNVENGRVKIGYVTRSSTATFEGSVEKESMSGEWKGLDVSASFQLKRTSVQPLSLYLEEEVSFQNGDATLVGTLVKPNKSGKHPAIVFTHGSGNQTRTESFYRSRAYLFARHGIAALIYDRRGKGASKGGDNVTWNNLADDALAGLRFLQSRSDINPKQIGISGFSQGGWVSPLAATRSKDVAFVLVGSAPAITPDEQNDYNVESLLRLNNVSEENIKAVMTLRKRVSQFQLTNTGNKVALESEISQLRSETWFRNTLLPDKLEPFDGESKAFITFDPAPIWEKVRVPVLLLWGAQDMVVPAQKSKTIIENALKKGENKEYELKIFDKAGHGVGVTRDKNEAWDFPRLASGYQEIMIEWTLKRVKVSR